jgi:hypothetical protein
MTMTMMANSATEAQLRQAVEAHGFVLQREGARWSITSTWWTPSKVTDDFTGSQIYEDPEGVEYTIQVDQETGDKSLLKLEATGYVLSPPRRDLVAKYKYIPVQLHADQHHTMIYLQRGYLMADPNTGKGDNDNVILEDSQKFAETALLPYKEEIERLKAVIGEQTEAVVRPVAPVAEVVPPITQQPGVIDVPDQDLTAFEKVLSDLDAVPPENAVSEVVEPQTLDEEVESQPTSDVTESVTELAQQETSPEGVACSMCVLAGKTGKDVFYAKSENALKGHLGSKKHNSTRKPNKKSARSKKK